MQNAIVPEIISEEQFNRLDELKVINHTEIRNIEMHKKFRKLREEGKSAGECIEVMMEEYPYIAYDTIRKICYSGSTSKNKMKKKL